MKLQYGKDNHGCEILEDENQIHQVMMEWEKPYMEKSIELFNPFGRVLEIGFGLGYSATKICEMKNVTEYNVIECCPVVWEKFNEWSDNQLIKRPNLKINLIKGRWQDVLSEEGIFDSIYFDDYNGDSNIHEMLTRYNHFVYNILKKHTQIGSKLCSFSTTDKNMFTNVKCLTFECHKYDIHIPDYCNYAKGDKMYIPIYTVISEPDSNLKDDILGNIIKTDQKIKEQVTKAREYYKKPKKIYCNLMIIDNFYTNAMETRNHILTQDFKVRGNYPGQRTESHANEHLKTMIEGYIQHFAGKITRWPTDKEEYNGSFQYTTSRDRTWLHTDSWNNWAGVLYLTPNAPVTAGTGIFKFRDGTRTSLESEARGNKEILDEHSQDYTKWELVDRVGNIFNRLVLFNATQYHASLDYFGTCKEDARLFQVFFFSTER
jgi:hypothetical protein